MYQRFLTKILLLYILSLIALAVHLWIIFEHHWDDEVSPILVLFVMGITTIGLLQSTIFRRIGVIGAFSLTLFVTIVIGTFIDGYDRWIAVRSYPIFGIFIASLIITVSLLPYTKNRTLKWASIFLLLLGFTALINVGVVAENRKSAEAQLGIALYVSWDQGDLLSLFFTGILVIVPIILFFREFVEFGFEVLFWIQYRMRFKKYIDLAAVADKPTIVIANHTCYQDPLFAGKVLPITVTPIMTSLFFNIWFLKPILKYLFRVIVVPDAPMRREAPELELAIASLDRKEIVMIFPEGYLRRKEEVPLRRFGQGIWQILKARPDTQIIAMWIEGGWGSYFSHKGGPPMSRKKLHFRRRIDVAYTEPFKMPTELLETHLPTRIYLMNKVLEAREQLNLSPIPKFELPEKSED